MSLRDDVKGAKDLRIKPVPTPEWPAADGKLFVRSISALDRERFSDQYRDADGKRHNLSAGFCVLTVCDAEGKPVFEAADAGWLGAEKDGVVIDRLATAAQELNVIGTKAVDDAAKNSETGPSAGSS